MAFIQVVSLADLPLALDVLRGPLFQEVLSSDVQKVDRDYIPPLPSDTLRSHTVNVDEDKLLKDGMEPYTQRLQEENYGDVSN